MRYTAEDARRGNDDDLDKRIRAAVKDAGSARGAYLRVYIEDSFVHRIGEELRGRGFTNVQVPDIVLKGDVYFEW
jgi:hypothetical protein